MFALAEQFTHTFFDCKTSFWVIWSLKVSGSCLTTSRGLLDTRRPAPEPAEHTEQVIDPTSGITASEAAHSPDVSETSTTEDATESAPCGKRRSDS